MNAKHSPRYAVSEDYGKLTLYDDKVSLSILSFDICSDETNVLKDQLDRWLGLLALKMVAYLMTNNFGQWNYHWQAKRPQ